MHLAFKRLLREIYVIRSFHDSFALYLSTKVNSKDWFRLWSKWSAIDSRFFYRAMYQ
jgi:hypothetical protein